MDGYNGEFTVGRSWMSTAYEVLGSGYTYLRAFGIRFNTAYISGVRNAYWGSGAPYQLATHSTMASLLISIVHRPQLSA